MIISYMPNFCGLCCASVSYSTIQYPKIDFWRAEFFFQVEITIRFLRTNWSVMIHRYDVRSMFTVHTRDGTGRDGQDGTLIF